MPTSIRRIAHLAFTGLLFAGILSGSMAVGVRAQVTEEMLRQAQAQTGLTREELLRLYQNGTEPQQGQQPSAEPLAPGRTELPPGNIQSAPAAQGLPGILPVTPQAGGTQPGQVVPGQTVAGQPTQTGVNPAVVAGPAPVLGPGTNATTQPAVAQLFQPQVFGAGFFRLQPGMFTQDSFGPVPEDYVLGPGDQVFVDVWGEVEFRLERVVDRDGTIILPKGGKILCAGRTLGDLKGAIRERLAASYSGLSTDPEHGTSFLDVSLGKLRAIRVFVVGDAMQPGAYDLSSMATIFTALYAAGGPSESGSMRNIRLMRGDKLVAQFDIYEYLVNGDRKNDVVLREYDTILVPPRGNAVRVDGQVRRPMIFELNEGETIRELLAYAGGYTAGAASEVLHVTRNIPAAERRPGQPDRMQVDIKMDPATGAPVDASQAELHDGDVVLVPSISERIENWVTVDGAVKRPGKYEYREGMELSTLLENAGQPWPDRLGELGIIDRNNQDGTRNSMQFPLEKVVSGEQKVLLQPMDAVHVYSKRDLEDRVNVSISGQVRQGGEFEYREGMTLVDLIMRAGGLLENADHLRAEVSRLREDAVRSRDEASEPAQVVDLVQVSLRDDYLSDPDPFPLQPYDRIAIRKLPWWELQQVVTISGEVMYPGAYALRRADETVADVLSRAKGLKPSAFAPGARIVRAVDDIGNIPVDLECAMKSPHSGCDPVLLNGDQIMIPSRPHTVRVAGLVGHPGAVPYMKGKSMGYYIDRAGGFAENSNRWKTQVVYPNGLARKIKRFWRDPPVEPGSSILVPPVIARDKGDRLATMEKIAGILASISTAYLVIDRVSN